MMGVFKNNRFLGCAGPSLPCVGFLEWWRAGPLSGRGAWGSRCSGVSCFGAQALEHRGSEVVGQGMPDLSFHPGIKPAPLAMEGWSPNWTARENPDYILKMS